jgi:predicted cytidylate kinase
MIISFNGDHGSGKSTIAEKISKELGYERVYLGQVFRNLAKERGFTLVEFAKLAETDPSIDMSVDAHIIELAKEKKDFVTESRTAWHFLPESLKIYLKVSPEEGARRMFEHLKSDKDSNRTNEDKGIETVEDVMESNKKRKEFDNIRYKKHYSIDPNNMSNYDLVIDTTNLTREEVLEKVLEFTKNEINKERK